MNIGIDLDGVLTNFNEFCMSYGTKYASEIGKEKIVNSKGYESIEIFSWDIQTDMQFWEKYNSKYAEEEKPRPFAKEVLDKLKADGHNIYIITARASEFEDIEAQSKMQDMVKNWFVNNELYYDELIFSTVNKLENCRENNIDIMIEDSPHNIKQLAEFLPIMCFDTRYNKNCEGRNIIRVYSFYDIYEKIKEFEKTKNPTE